jgi:hypothetical protein
LENRKFDIFLNYLVENISLFRFLLFALIIVLLLPLSSLSSSYSIENNFLTLRPTNNFTDESFLAYHSSFMVLSNDERFEINHLQKSNFEPSMKTLVRIMRLMRERNTIGRTTLSSELNINYAIISKYVDWMER